MADRGSDASLPGPLWGRKGTHSTVMSDLSSDQRPLVPDDRLQQAYAAAEYCCSGHVLRVGHLHPEFDVWLNERAYEHYAYLTAHNPRSHLLSPAANAARHEQLERMLRLMKLPFAPAEGRDPSGEWAAEPGVLLFDVPAAQVHELGRIFEQNAVVEGKIGGVPLLVWIG